MKRWLFAWILLLPMAARAEVQEVKAGDATAWMVESHDVPIFTLQLAFTDSGAAYDPRGKEGLASLMSDTFTEGAGDMNALAFHRALDNKAIHLSVSVNQDTTIVTLESLSENRDEALRLLALMLTQPRFDEAAVARLKKETAAIIRRRQEDPDSVADDAWREAAWAGHAYARPAIGTETSLATIAPADIKTYRHTHLTRGKLIAAAVGDITPAQLAPFLKDLAAALPDDAEGTAITDIQVAAAGQKTVERAIPQTVVMFGVEGIARQDPRYYTAYILNHIVGGGELDTRLMGSLRGKEGLVYYAYTTIDDLRHAQAWRGAFATSSDKVAQAMAMVRQAFRELADTGVTQQELDDAKRYITGSFPLRINNNGALASYLISMQYEHLGIDYLDKRNGYIEAVTLAQVNALAKTLLAAKNLVTVSVGTTTEGRITTPDGRK